MYGAIVLPGQPGASIEVLTASAGSAPATQLLGVLAQNISKAAQAQGGAPATVTDVVPLAETDARGAGLALTGLPLAITATTRERSTTGTTRPRPSSPATAETGLARYLRG